jgi:hypothetical protein
MCPGVRAYVKHKPYCRIINFSYALMQWYYAGAHRKLTQTGYDFRSTKRFGAYLTKYIGRKV